MSQPQNYGSDSPAWTLTHPLIRLFICSFTKSLTACLVPVSELGLGRNTYTTQTLPLWHLLRGTPAINKHYDNLKGGECSLAGMDLAPSLLASSHSSSLHLTPWTSALRRWRLSYHFHLCSHEGDTLHHSARSSFRCNHVGSRFLLKVSGKWLFLLKSTKNKLQVS